MTDFNTMNEHLQELLEEREDLYARIHSLNEAVTTYFKANQRLAEQLAEVEKEREYWAGLVQRNS